MQLGWTTTHVVFDDGAVIVLKDASNYHDSHIGVAVNECRDVMRSGIVLWRRARSYRWSNNDLLARISEGPRDECILWEDYAEILRRQSTVKQKGKCIDCGYGERLECSLRCQECKSKLSMVNVS